MKSKNVKIIMLGVSSNYKSKKGVGLYCQFPLIYVQYIWLIYIKNFGVEFRKKFKNL